MRREQRPADAAAAALGGDGDGQDFGLVEGGARQDEAGQSLIPEFDCPVRHDLRADEELFEVGFAPGMGEAPGMEQRRIRRCARGQSGDRPAAALWRTA